LGQFDTVRVGKVEVESEWAESTNPEPSKVSNFPALMAVAQGDLPDLIERRSLNPASFRQALSFTRDARGCDQGSSSIQRMVQPVTTELSGGRS